MGTRRTSLFQKVDARYQPQSRQLETAYALQSSTATVRVDEVKFGQQGTGGGRYVFDRRSYATAKRGPGKVAVQATVQAPGFQPMKLRLHLSWNKYYQTEALQNAFEHPVDNLQQIPKLTGRDHDTWISCPNLTEDFEDFGNDCYILISRLHPSVDGLQQVDKFDPDQKKLAIRVPLYNDTELNEINQNISTQQPVVQKQHKVNPHLVLNELTVAEFHGLDPNGNTVDQETVAKIFAGIGRLPHRLPLPEQAIPASTLYPFPVLPSTVIDESRLNTLELPIFEMSTNTLMPGLKRI